MKTLERSLDFLLIRLCNPNFIEQGLFIEVSHINVVFTINQIDRVVEIHIVGVLIQ